MLEYSIDEKAGGFNIKGDIVKINPNELTILKMKAFEQAYTLLKNSGRREFKLIDILKDADTLVGWALMVDNPNTIK